MLIYRGELVSGPAALPRLLLRELIYEKVFLGPVNVNDGTVARLINEPTGGLRIDYWKRGASATTSSAPYLGQDKPNHSQRTATTLAACRTMWVVSSTKFCAGRSNTRLALKSCCD